MKVETTLKNNGELKKAVLRAAQDNHLWVNAFSLIRPTDETLRNIGREVVSMLQRQENLLPAYHGEKDREPISNLQTLTGMLYLSINQS